MFMDNKYKAHEKFFCSTLMELYRSTRLAETENFIQHGSTTVLRHSIMVAYMSYKLCKILHINIKDKDIIRGALLHDYFLYDWHEKNKGHRLHGFSHPKTALDNAKRDTVLTETEEEIIIKHMFPLTLYPPTKRESVIVCMTDKICSLYETFHINKVWEWKSYNIAQRVCREVKNETYKRPQS